MYVASGEGHADVVKVLTNAGANVNQACTKVIHYQVRHPYHHGIFSLIQEPHSVPLEIAADRGHIETVDILLEADATVNYQNMVCVTM